jgi:uncharacterized surface protein with fasciclin (FAS1) repeats
MPSPRRALSDRRLSAHLRSRHRDGKTAATVNGAEVTVKVDGGSVWVDSAMVTATDIECTNGVIHIIDSVIIPK